VIRVAGGDPHEYEDQAPGNIISYNDDDDNGNGVPAREEEGAFQTPGGDPATDDDLESATLGYDDGAEEEEEAPDLEGFSLSFAQSGATLKVWDTMDKQHELTDAVFTIEEDGVARATVGGDELELPGTVYVEGCAIGEADLSFVFKNPAGHEVNRDTVKFTVVDVNLTISNGQDGDAVPEASEETVGAFTVANLNDTDGDGVQDDVDTDGVIGTANGRDEVDLMQLIVAKPHADMQGPLVLTVSDGVALWEESTKVTPIPLDDFGMVDFYPSDFAGGDITLWVELPLPSTSVRDIQIEADYHGIKDKVKATGVWATLTAVEHETRDASDLLTDPAWAEMPSPPRPLIESYAGGTGLRPIGPHVVNAIAMRFTVQPTGIQDVDVVHFDVTRRINRSFWYLDENGQVVNPPEPPARKPFPPKNEEANDDPPGSPEPDESEAPNSDGHMFVGDSPGRVTVEADYAMFVYRFSAQELVRVGFGSVVPEGNGVHGSRSSANYEWHVRHRLENVNGVWQRTTGDAQETDENDIGPGAIDPGEQP